MSQRSLPPRQLWWLAAGFTVWCSALATLYAIHGIGCAFGWSAGSLRLWLGLALLSHLMVLGWMCHIFSGTASGSGYDSTGAFFYWAVAATLLTALVATAITFGPPLLLTACI